MFHLLRHLLRHPRMHSRKRKLNFTFLRILAQCPLLLYMPIWSKKRRGATIWREGDLPLVKYTRDNILHHSVLCLKLAPASSLSACLTCPRPLFDTTPPPPHMAPFAPRLFSSLKRLFYGFEVVISLFWARVMIYKWVSLAKGFFLEGGMVVLKQRLAEGLGVGV